MRPARSLTLALALLLFAGLLAQVVEASPLGHHQRTHHRLATAGGGHRHHHHRHQRPD